MRYHLIGIGGIGMSAIARLLLAKGDFVSGSDLRRSEITDNLQKEGAKITIGHKTDTIANYSPDAVVYSAAITPIAPGFVELEAAKQQKIKTLRRAEMIKELMAGKSGIAVSGMHGKTTTTSMLAQLIIKADEDPTVLIGGIADSIKSNARLGKGKYFVVEACEYDKTFLEFNYDRAIITNIEEEHMDFFGNLENILKTFKEFITKLPSEGLLIACGDNQNVQKIIKTARSRLVTYGFGKENDVVIDDFKIIGSKIIFKLNSAKIEFKNKEFSLKVPGKHNALNACAAIICAKDLGISEDLISREISNFSGIKRRMEIYDCIDDILVMDDYAHHPTEISATLEALREFYKTRRFLVVFRPSQYSRNLSMLSEYGKSFSDADIVLVPRTYEPAGRDQEKDKSVDSERIVEEIEKNGKKAEYLPEFSDVTQYLKTEAKQNDLVITMGLGPLYELTKEIVKMLKERNK